MTGNGVFGKLTYTANDDVALVQQVAAGDQTNFLYGYNKVHQVTATTVTNPAHAWVPAAAGNTSYTANALNQYTAVGPLVPAYDGNGNLTSDGITGYGYDVENRLVSVNRAGMTAGYTYDVLGRRHSKTVNGVTTVFLHDGDREIAELDGTGAILRRYVHAAGLDEVIATIEADGTQRFLHRDTLGSVVAVTDAGGAVVERHAYGPFGESAVLTGTPWRFAGQRLDPESGLYYMRGRHYNPMLGRFVQPDPIGYEGGLNLYAYVNNDPLNLADPMGTEPVNGASALNLLDPKKDAITPVYPLETLAGAGGGITRVLISIIRSAVSDTVSTAASNPYDPSVLVGNNPSASGRRVNTDLPSNNDPAGTAKKLFDEMTQGQTQQSFKAKNGGEGFHTEGPNGRTNLRVNPDNGTARIDRPLNSSDWPQQNQETIHFN